jgi:hypothetical protein
MSGSEIRVTLSHAALSKAVEKTRGQEWFLRQHHEYAQLYGQAAVDALDLEMDYMFMEIARRGLGLKIDLDRSDEGEAYIVHGFTSDDDAVLFMMRWQGAN